MKFTSSANYFLSILHFLNERGITAEQALTAIDFSQFDSNNNEQRVSLSHYSALLEFAEKQLEQPLFGFYLGKDIKSADFGVLGYLVESSKDLTTAIASLLKYDQLVANIGQADFSRKGKLAKISWQPYQACNRQVILRNFTAWVAIARQLLNTELAPRAVYFSDHWSTQEQAVLADWFNCPIQCNANHNAIEFPSAYLNLQFSSANPQLYASLEQFSQQQLKQFNQDHNLTKRLQALLVSKADLFDCQLSTIANCFNISVRQLQRKLKAENTSFAELIDLERKRRALLLLGKQPVGSIATACGFSEQSSFNKAFARWYQCSPSAYLKQLSSKQ